MILQHLTGSADPVTGSFMIEEGNMATQSRRMFLGTALAAGAARRDGIFMRRTKFQCKS